MTAVGENYNLTRDNMYIGEFYRLPFLIVIFIGILLIACWSAIACKIYQKKKKFWKLVNLILLISAVILILYLTLLDRYTEVREIVLIPFYSFIEARKQPEVYRTLLMNVFLFLPYGLSFPYALPEHFENKVRITVLSALCFSAIIEGCQCFLCLGRCEIDDVIMNTFGAVIGSLSYVISEYVIYKNNSDNIL